MTRTLFKNARIVNRNSTFQGDLLIENARIVKVDKSISPRPNDCIEDLDGRYLLPGVIDDQVHFREPGFPTKGNIRSESRAAVAGGTTSFMEMPNTNPQTLTQARLEEKFAIAAKCSPANYSFFMGASNDNLEEVLKTDPKWVCGVKIFMGSSTGNMLVDHPQVLESLFAQCPILIATHCEDETTVRQNMETYLQKYGNSISPEMHPMIRSAEACYLSSSMATSLASKHQTRLHILHISTGIETALFRNDLPLREKRITSEACVHHLSFSDSDYRLLKNQIKCNPAIKSDADREAIWTALLDDRIDIIATDHAPHTWDEKQQPYAQAPSGLPLVQHSLVMMMQHVLQGRLSIERMVDKMSHAPAACFRIVDRGYLDEGAWADLVIFDQEVEWTIDKSNLLYHCGWSPLEGRSMKGNVQQTWVNGQCVFRDGKVMDVPNGMRLQFEAER